MGAVFIAADPKQIMRRTLQIVVMCLVLQLLGCATSSELTTLVALTRGEFSSASHAFDKDALNPAYRYMRVTLDGAAPALMVLGYVDSKPGGAVDVWYSALGEVIKTQKGRIVSTTGLALDWSSVVYPVAPLDWALQGDQVSGYERVRSELPAYRVGLRERMVVTPESAPTDLRLFASGPTHRWYREHTDAPSFAGTPDSWFAVGHHKGQEVVVFSRQCLSSTQCLSLQLWPVQEEAL